MSHCGRAVTDVLTDGTEVDMLTACSLAILSLPIAVHTLPSTGCVKKKKKGLHWPSDLCCSTRARINGQREPVCLAVRRA